MRSHLLILASTILLGGCGTDEKSAEQSSTEESLNIAIAEGNDITAIDAATGDDANMAADVEFTSNELDALENELDGNGSGNGA